MTSNNENNNHDADTQETVEETVQIESTEIKIDLSSMCDRCYIELSDDEKYYGFHITDIHATTRLFKGHMECVDEMATTFNNIYMNNDSELASSGEEGSSDGENA